MKRFVSLAMVFSICILTPFVRAQEPAAPAPTAEWTISQIGDPRYVQSEPEVGSNGRVVWRGYGTGPVEEENSTSGITIFTWKDGQLQNLSAMVAGGNGHTHPRIHGDKVLWHVTRHPDTLPDQGYTWVLQEVPAGNTEEGQRDYPYKELAAFYAAGNRLAAEGKEGDFNLRPESQVVVGPVANYAEYLKLYHSPEATKITNVFGVVEQANPPAPTWNEAELQEQLAEGEIKNDFSNPASLAARRRTIEWGEIVSWSEKDGLVWETWDTRNDFAPNLEGNLMAWKKAKSYPFGWEIMARKGAERFQLTTNFYYDMAPKVFEDEVVWYGWDGNDFEIYSWNVEDKQVRAITDNNFDDMSPVVGEAGIAWEAYPTPDAAIHFRPRGSEDTLELSVNIDADTGPLMDGDRIVWQGFDGDDHEIYLFEASKFTGGPDDRSVTKITSNLYEDMHPRIEGNHVVWIGYHDNWDGEVFVYDLTTRTISQLTDNDVEDRNVSVGGNVIAWETVGEEESKLHVAVRK